MENVLIILRYLALNQTIYIIFYCTTLYYTILHYTILYYIVAEYTM